MEEKANNTNQEDKVQEEKINQSTDKVKKDFSGLLGSLKTFLADLLDIRGNTDQETTIDEIKGDIAFKGHTSWILICSIFIASVGLNANSTAVVIGAMLISPLMGPILGMGMSLAINDIDTLRRSVKNFLVMVVLSVLTAFLFFKLFPLRDESSELLARTAPDIRDVLIAFFGGLALVIARAKKGTIASVIFGVAIATALMPPLCTVGFGLAIWNLQYAGGAMYLFIINTIFIGLATFLVLKILRFPMVRYANSARRRFIARVASIVAIIVIVPALFTFYNVWQESMFKKNANSFINEKVKTYQFSDQGYFLDKYNTIEYNGGDNPIIELVFGGGESIPDNVIQTWRTQMATYPYLENATLEIKGGKDDSEEKFKYVSELYESKKREMETKDQRISVLENELEKLSMYAYNQIPFAEISKEAKINYQNLEEFAFAFQMKTNYQKTDTIPVFYVKMKKTATASKELEKMKEWLKVRTNNTKVEVKQVN
ncbi:DUF389 domain-containing protein [Zhouia amylolytica]|uniref:Putative membrane protein n=1 Tax=Zhouia amylolytica AD3 TaxID=1286632 RepID=W2URN5_9FLAO|nr:DUF389 domain-containing protein [Zhouia amylolytica]ETN96614.1 putative membrane protein [Zhouia amylolytica AD3]